LAAFSYGCDDNFFKKCHVKKNFSLTVTTDMQADETSIGMTVSVRDSVRKYWLVIQGSSSMEPHQSIKM